MLPAVARARGFPLRGGVDLRMVVALQVVRDAATHASVSVALCVAVLLCRRANHARVLRKPENFVPRSVISGGVGAGVRSACFCALCAVSH